MQYVYMNRSSYQYVQRNLHRNNAMMVWPSTVKPFHSQLLLLHSAHNTHNARQCEFVWSGVKNLLTNHICSIKQSTLRKKKKKKCLFFIDHRRTIIVMGVFLVANTLVQDHLYTSPCFSSPCSSLLPLSLCLPLCPFSLWHDNSHNTYPAHAHANCVA